MNVSEHTGPQVLLWVDDSAEVGAGHLDVGRHTTRNDRAGDQLADPLVSDHSYRHGRKEEPRRVGTIRASTIICAALLLSGCASMATSGGTCRERILDEAAAEGLAIVSSSMQAVHGGRDNDRFMGYRAEMRAADGKSYGALTNRSCTHLRIWRY